MSGNDILELIEVAKDSEEYIEHFTCVRSNKLKVFILMRDSYSDDCTKLIELAANKFNQDIFELVIYNGCALSEFTGQYNYCMGSPDCIMIKEEVLRLSDKIKHRFIRDYKLPIQVVSEPYFSYLLHLYDKEYACLDKLDILLRSLAQYNSEQEFLVDTNKQRNKLAAHFKSKVRELRLVNMAMTNYDFPHRTLSVPDNIDKSFISIKINDIGYLVYKLLNYSDLRGCERLEQFMELCGVNEYFLKSPTLKENIFLIAKNSTLQNQVNNILESIIKEIEPLMVSDNLYSVGADGLIYNVESAKEGKTLAQRIKDMLDIDVTVEAFTLRSVTDTKYFVKDYCYKLELVDIPLCYFAQVYNKLHNNKINKLDLGFIFEGNLASFNNALF